ncbi:LysE family translocator [Massilia sp. IC2-476]|uniref:LysE family translocator n=1 Tax=Massilia sp. IC2-476 TaxID=2887199 RepID=UPI001D128179|nr:LysE family translocator [Massilia sp. IC2-476]MCC2971019.1 LysE family translocator [Massilia sp. IC2-476]
MDSECWSAFLLASLVTAFTPGQAILLAVSNTLERGRSHALVSSSGNIAGLFIVAGAAAAGLGLLMQELPWTLQALRIGGALYLIYLGLQPWWPARPTRIASVPRTPAPTRRDLFMQGLTVAATNPKGLLFFGALFPQFVGTGPGLAARFLALTLSFAACTLVAHAVYILAAPWAGARLRDRVSPASGRKLAGSLFVLLGLGLLLA